MNKQELWEDCFKNVCYATYSNPYVAETVLTTTGLDGSDSLDRDKELREACERIANAMVEQIMVRRNKSNRETSHE